MKKTILILGGVIIVLAIVVILLFVLGGSKETQADDPDSLYKYYYENDGADVVVTVRGEFPNGYKWIADEQPDAAAKVKCESSESDEASFRVSPAGKGRYTLSLALESDGIIPDRIYEILVSFEVDVNKLTIISSTHKELKGLTSVEKDGYKYAFSNGAENGLYIRVEKKPSELAVYVTGKTVSVSTVGEEENAENIVFVVTPVSVGSASIKVCDVEAKKAIQFDVEVSTNGIVSVRSHNVIDYDTETDPKEENKKEAEEIAGTITLPEGYEMVSSRTSTFSVGYTESYEYVDITVSTGKKQIACMVVPDAGVEAVSTRFMSEGAEITDTKVGKYDGVTVKEKYYVTVIWEENGKTIAVSETTAASEDILADAEAISGSFGNAG